MRLLALVLSALAACGPAGAGSSPSVPASPAAEQSVPWPPPPPTDAARAALRKLFRVAAPFSERQTSRAPGCVLSGSVDALYLPLFATPTATEPFGILERADISRVEPPGSLDSPVEITMAWPLASTVFARQDSLPFCLREPTSLDGELAWLGPCTRVSAAIAPGANVVQVARGIADPPAAAFVPASFSRTVQCDALELPRLANLFPTSAKLRGPRLPDGGDLAELTQAVTLVRRPGVPGTTRVGGPGWPVMLHETRGPWALVSERSATRWGNHGFDFLGWVPSASVRKGGLPYAVELGRVQIQPSHQVCDVADVRVAPRLGAPVVARLARALPVLAVSHEGDFAAVMIPDFTPASTGLWLHRSALCAAPSPP